MACVEGFYMMLWAWFFLSLTYIEPTTTTTSPESFFLWQRHRRKFLWQVRNVLLKLFDYTGNCFCNWIVSQKLLRINSERLALTNVENGIYENWSIFLPLSNKCKSNTWGCDGTFILCRCVLAPRNSLAYIYPCIRSKRLLFTFYGCDLRNQSKHFDWFGW